MGGHKNIAKVLSEIHDPPVPKKMVTPLETIIFCGFASNFTPSTRIFVALHPLNKILLGEHILCNREVWKVTPTHI